MTGSLTPSGCASTSTITVTVLNPGTIGSAQANCGAFTPATLGSISDASGTTGITYQWQSSTTSAVAGFGNITSATATTYSPGSTTTSTWFRRVATGGGLSLNSNTVAITVNTIPVVTISPTTTAIAAGGSITLTAAGATDYTWSPAAGLSSSTTAAVVASPATTTFYTVTGSLTPSGCASTSTITVTVLNPGTIGSAQANCGAFTPATLGSISDASGTTGITYQWQSSTTSAVAGFGNITSATATTYSPGSTTTSTWFRRVATGGGLSLNSNTVAIIVNTIPVVTISPTTTAIVAGASITLTASGATGYTWSPTAGLSSSNTAAVVASPATTTFYAVAGSLTPSGCAATSSITVVVFNAGIIASSQVGCGPYTPVAFTSTADASGPAGITYQWQSSTISATAGFTNIAAATLSGYAPSGVITATTWYRRVATASGLSINSNTVTATLTAAPVVDIAPSSVTIAAGLTQTLTASGGTTYAWSPATTLSAATGASVIATPTVTTTYTVTGSTAGCPDAAASATITVLSPGTIGGAQAGCGSVILRKFPR